MRRAAHIRRDPRAALSNLPPSSPRLYDPGSSFMVKGPFPALWFRLRVFGLGSAAQSSMRQATHICRDPSAPHSNLPPRRPQQRHPPPRQRDRPAWKGSGLRVQGLGFGVHGLGFRVHGLGFRVQGLGFRVWGLGFRVWGCGFRVRDEAQEEAQTRFRRSRFQKGF